MQFQGLMPQNGIATPTIPLACKNVYNGQSSNVDNFAQLCKIKDSGLLQRMSTPAPICPASDAGSLRYTWGLPSNC